MIEALRALLLAHGGDRVLICDAGGVLIAEELHVAAERNGRNLPARAVAIVEADQFGAKPYRKDQNLYADPTGDQEVPELVEKDHDGQDEKERENDAQKSAAQGKHTRYDF